MTTDVNPSIRILLAFQAGHMLAHCLEFDVMAQGPTWKEAEYRLFRALAIEKSLARRFGQTPSCAPSSTLRTWENASRLESPQDVDPRLGQHVQTTWGNVERRFSFSGL